MSSIAVTFKGAKSIFVEQIIKAKVKLSQLMHNKDSTSSIFKKTSLLFLIRIQKRLFLDTAYTHGKLDQVPMLFN